MAEAARTTDIFLFLESTKSGVIKGESMDNYHPNEIEVTSTSISINNATDTEGEGDWKPDFADLSLTLYTSRASTFLFRAAADGSTFKRATVSFRKSGAKGSGEANGDFMQWRFYNARISSYSLGGSGEKPTETIGLTYENIEIMYIKQAQTGALDEKFQQGWMVGKNCELSPLSLPYKGQGAKS